MEGARNLGEVMGVSTNEGGKLKSVQERNMLHLALLSYGSPELRFKKICLGGTIISQNPAGGP